MSADKLLLALIPFIFAAGNAKVENKIYVEGNAQVTSQSTATVNGQTISVSSDQPGSVSVELKDGSVNIIKDQQVKPTIIITGIAGSSVSIEETVIPTITQSINENKFDQPEIKAKPVLEIIRQFLVKFFRNLGFGGNK